MTTLRRTLAAILLAALVVGCSVPAAPAASSASPAIHAPLPPVNHAGKKP